MRDELISLESELRAKGLLEEADEIHELVDEAEALERPATWMQRMKGRVGSLARSQWDHIRQEIDETKELSSLLRQRVRGDIEELDPVQKEKVKAQLLDLFKVVPASALAVGNFVAPIPCSSWLTPALLMSLGLMPSAWKEAHMGHRLGKVLRKLRDKGHLDEAGGVRVILEDLRAEAHHRERMAAIASDQLLLGLYDANRDGTLDAAEQAQMHKVLDRTVAAMRKRWGARIWYVFRDGDVAGPFTLVDIDALGCTDETLLCRAGTKHWVPLKWVLRELEDLDRAVSGPSAGDDRRGG